MRPGPHPRPFWSQVAFGRECWEWVGNTWQQNGYGSWWDGANKRRVLAHRIAYELTVGDVPDGMLVLHSCDNRRCVRPDHLRVGTAADNMRDMVERGRSLRGPLNHQTKLTVEQVRLIRVMLGKGYTKALIARELVVSEAAIWSIATGRTWTWVGE